MHTILPRGSIILQRPLELDRYCLPYPQYYQHHPVINSWAQGPHHLSHLVLNCEPPRHQNFLFFEDFQKLYADRNNAEKCDIRSENLPFILHDSYFHL